jgi:hypothetical protein
MTGLSLDRYRHKMTATDQQHPDLETQSTMPPKLHFKTTQDPGIPPIEPGTTTFIAKTIIASGVFMTLRGKAKVRSR